MLRNNQESDDVFDLFRGLSFGPLKADFIPYELKFNKPAKTSRNTITEKTIWLLRLYEKHTPEIIGYGEVAPLAGLSIETPSQIENALIDICVKPDDWNQFIFGKLDNIPSVQFALEQALLDLNHQGEKILFPSKFTEGNEIIPINGLIWMGSPQYMIDQINEKIKSGFKCLKLKIGALNFNDELNILTEIRNTFGYHDLEIRVDANGAFDFDEAIEALDQLAPLEIHSIEQPIKAGNWEDMAELCRISPIQIALDEECIGAIYRDEKEEILETILPHYIILKPSLLGGFQQSEEWIELAGQYDISWWVTSALESNIGLNAIAQWTFTKYNPMYQGLGTGQLFSNNFNSPLYLNGEHLMFDPNKSWQLGL